MREGPSGNDVATKRRGPSKPVIAAAIIAAVLVAGLAMGYAMLSNQASQGGVSMSVNRALAAQDDLAAEEGQTRWLLNVTITNERDHSLPIGPSYFELSTTHGALHRPQAETDSSQDLGGDLEGKGGSRTFNLVFDLREGEEPSTLTYDALLAKTSAGVPKAESLGT